MIKQVEKQDIPECVEAIRASFLTVAKQYDITKEDGMIQEWTLRYLSIMLRNGENESII